MLGASPSRPLKQPLPLQISSYVPAFEIEHTMQQYFENEAEPALALCIITRDFLDVYVTTYWYHAFSFFAENVIVLYHTCTQSTVFLILHILQVICQQ